MNGKTILIVDDDAKLLLALQKRLVHSGYDVLTATDGDQALQQVWNSHVDAICLDVTMPGHLTGLEVASRLHNDPETARIPVVFITGSADPGFKQKCERVGARYFMSKPFDSELLLQTLRGIFGADAVAELHRLSSAKRRQPVSAAASSRN